MTQQFLYRTHIREPRLESLNIAPSSLEAGILRVWTRTLTRLQSSNPRIWAAGDVTGHPEFVYVAAHHGTLVAEVADAWAHYLTRAAGIRIAAKAFTTDPSLLSCCA